MKNYYEAYDERYKAVHEKNLRCMGYESSPIVAEVLKKYAIPSEPHPPYASVWSPFPKGEGQHTCGVRAKSFDSL